MQAALNGAALCQCRHSNRTSGGVIKNPLLKFLFGNTISGILITPAYAAACSKEGNRRNAYQVSR